MSPEPAETPAQLRDLLGKEFRIASRVEFERLRCPGAARMECKICNHPVSKAGELYAMGLVSGGAADERTRLKDRFLTLFRLTGLSIPGTRQLVREQHLVLLVPWLYRGEFRAVFTSAAATWSAGKAGDEAYPASSLFASLPADDNTRFDYASFKDQLYSFVLDFEGPLQSVLRRVFARHTLTRTWRFPLGCSVQETRSPSSVAWEISFEDLELLERSHVLVEPVIGRLEREGGSLRVGDPEPAEEDGAPTAQPALRLKSSVNSRGVRVEMARLVKDLILSLEAFDTAPYAAA